MTHYQCQDCKATSERNALVFTQQDVPVEFWNLTKGNTIDIERCRGCAWYHR